MGIIRGEEEIVQFVTQKCLQSLEKLNYGELCAAVLTSRPHRSQVHRDLHGNRATDYTDLKTGPQITRIKGIGSAYNDGGCSSSLPQTDAHLLADPLEGVRSVGAA